MTTGRTISGVYIDYTQYMFSHGRSPRGTGMWAFVWDNEIRMVDGTFQAACQRRATHVQCLILSHARPCCPKDAGHAAAAGLADAARA